MIQGTQSSSSLLSLKSGPILQKSGQESKENWLEIAANKMGRKNLDQPDSNIFTENWKIHLDEHARQSNP
jgi:hypothetical protein